MSQTEYTTCGGWSTAFMYLHYIYILFTKIYNTNSLQMLYRDIDKNNIDYILLLIVVYTHTLTNFAINTYQIEIYHIE